MNAQLLLEDALAWLSDSSHWCQDEYAENSLGDSCSPVHASRTDILGALARAARVSIETFFVPMEDWDESLAVAVRRIAQVVDPGNRVDEPGELVQLWNDQTSRSHEDVVLLLKRTVNPEGETK